MIIGYDGKRAVFNGTGLGNYSRLLVDVMARYYPDNTYRVYTPRIKKNPRLSDVVRHSNVELVPPRGGRFPVIPALWRSCTMGREMVTDGCNLIHGLSGELPLNTDRLEVPSVVTVHDVIFRRCPELYHAIDRRIYDYKLRKAVNMATRVIAVSERTARDVSELYDIDPSKIDVVYQGCDARFRRHVSEDEVAAVKERYGLQRPYIICVGTVEERKNQMTAVRGMRFVPAELDLVIVGRRTAYARELDSYIRTYNLKSRIKFITDVRFSDLPALYAGAFCSSYTALYEGFGIPVIESLSVGTPVIIASGSCLEEAAGPLAPVVAPDDVNEWVNVIKELCNYPETRANIAASGREYVARFSDREMARGTMECYNKAVDTYLNTEQYGRKKD